MTSTASRVPDHEAPRSGRCLVLRRGAIGDSVCWLPILEAAARCSRSVTFAGRGDVAELFAAYRACDRGCSSEDLELWRWGTGGSGERPRILEHFDWLVGDLPAAEAGPGGQLLTRFDVVVDPSLPRNATIQLIERAKAVWPWTWPQVSARPRLRVPRRPTPGRVWLHPGAGGPRKVWPGMPALARELRLGGCLVDASFGEADAELFETWRGIGDARCRWFSSLVDLAAGLATAACFVGNDSGIAHLAAAIGVPTLVVFGPTDPRVWAPSGPGLRRVYQADFAGDPGPLVERIAAEVRAILSTLE